MISKVKVQRKHYRQAVKAMTVKGFKPALACACVLAQAFMEHFKTEQVTCDAVSAFVRLPGAQSSKEFHAQNKEVSRPIQTLFDQNYDKGLSADKIFKMTQVVLKDKGLKMVVEVAP